MSAGIENINEYVEIGIAAERRASGARGALARIWRRSALKNGVA
jgi:hypothetical protein